MQRHPAEAMEPVLLIIFKAGRRSLYRPMTVADGTVSFDENDKADASANKIVLRTNSPQRSNTIKSQSVWCEQQWKHIYYRWKSYSIQ